MLRCSGVFAKDPGRHAAVVLDDGGLEGIDEGCAHLLRELHEHSFVDEEPLLAVADDVAVAVDVLEVHADAGAEAAEEHAAGTEHTPQLRQHLVEVLVVAGEVKDGIAEDDVGEGVREWELLDDADLEVFRGKAVAEGCGKIADMGHTGGVGVESEDFAALPEEIDEVASVAAAGVEDAQAGGDVAAEDLVEDVDIDLAELFLSVERHT